MLDTLVITAIVRREAYQKKCRAAWSYIGFAGRIMAKILFQKDVFMSDHEQTEVESNDEDSMADAISAVAAITIAVAIAIYWVSSQ